jgi:hypothetical protein
MQLCKKGTPQHERMHTNRKWVHDLLGRMTGQPWCTAFGSRDSQGSYPCSRMVAYGLKRLQNSGCGQKEVRHADDMTTEEDDTLSLQVAVRSIVATPHMCAFAVALQHAHCWPTRVIQCKVYIAKRASYQQLSAVPLACCHGPASQAAKHCHEPCIVRCSVCQLFATGAPLLLYCLSTTCLIFCSCSTRGTQLLLMAGCCGPVVGQPVGIDL